VKRCWRSSRKPRNHRAGSEKLLEEKRALEKRVEQMKEMLAHAKVSDLESQAKDVKGVKVLAIQVPAWTANNYARWWIRFGTS